MRPLPALLCALALLAPRAAQAGIVEIAQRVSGLE
jgi:hypothetical protein